jgi:hypothetical protein
MNSSLSEMPPISEFADVDPASCDRNQDNSIVVWSPTMVGYYLSDPNHVPSVTSPGTLVATIQHLGDDDSIYVQSFLSAAGTREHIKLSLGNSGAPE